MHCSDHARTRMEQRGISKEMLGYLMTYGKKRTANNAQSVLIGKKQTQTLKAVADKLQTHLSEKQKFLQKLKKWKRTLNTIGDI